MFAIKKITALQDQIIEWAGSAKEKKSPELTELINIYNVLQDSKHIEVNRVKREQQLGGLRGKENLRREQLRFLYSEEDGFDFTEIKLPEDIVSELKINWKKYIKEI